VTRPPGAAGAVACRVTQLLALLALTGSAAGAEYILLPPADTAIAGEPISLVLTSCCNI
jgi:hypothetical protein